MMKSFTTAMVLFMAQPAVSFAPSISPRSSTAPLFVGGGNAWDNNNYLDALGGDQEQLEDASDKYQDYSKTRATFMQRQKEYAEKLSQTEEGRAHLEKYQRMMESRNTDHGDENDNDDDDVFDDVTTSGGGTMMGRMMAQARKQQRRNPQMPSSVRKFGFEQKFAVPLEGVNAMQRISPFQYRNSGIDIGK